MNKVVPLSKKPIQQKWLAKRWYIIKEWSIAILGFPIAIIWLPLSPCLPNPISLFTQRANIRNMRTSAKYSEDKGCELIYLNSIILLQGACSIVTAGCFGCGCCTIFSPKDLFDD